MKKSVLKLLSSVYILLVSVILIVISAYAWMVISDSPMAGNMNTGVAGREMIGLPDKDYDIWNGSTVNINSIERDANGVFIIRTAAEFATVMRHTETEINDPAVGDITMRLEADISMADLDWWYPIQINETRNTNTVTILGNGKEIVCLASPLFAGGAAGESSIVIKDLTIGYSEVTSRNSKGSGAFIESVDGVQNVTLENCHLIDSSVTGANNTGALIGYTAGKDGVVETTVNITNCTVKDSEIRGIGTVGGILGRSGADPATYQYIENCNVIDTTLISTDTNENKGIGSIIGVANLGDTYIINCIDDGVIETGHVADASGLVYGLEDFGTTGLLVIINGDQEIIHGNRDKVVTVSTPDEFIAAMQLIADDSVKDDITINIENDIDMTGVSWTPVVMATQNSTATITINGSSNSIVGLSAPLLAGGVENQNGQEKLIINNLLIQNSTMSSANTSGSGAFIECVAGLESVELNNCHLINSTLVSSSPNTGGLIGNTYAAVNANNRVATTITLTNCSVEGSNITGAGTVGGILGHASEDSEVTTVLEDCYVMNTKLTTTQAGAKGIGTIVGTVDHGQTEITNCTFTGITEVPVSGESNTEDVPFGRISLDDTAKLVITEGEDKYEYVKGTLTVTAVTAGAMFKGFGIYSDGFDGTVNIEQGGDIDLSSGLGGLFSVTPAETTAPVTEPPAPVETTTPAETTASAETTVPVETTVPTETTVAVETTLSAETTVPVETTAPAETTVPTEVAMPVETIAPAETTAPYEETVTP